MLTDKKSFFKSKLFYIILLLIFIFCVIMYFIFTFKPSSTTGTTDEVINSSTEVTTEEIPINTEGYQEPIIVTPQEEVVSFKRGKIVSIQDNSSSIMYTVSIGVDANAVETQVKATYDTLFYDIISEGVVGPEFFKEGSDIMLYTTGSSEKGDLHAIALALGFDSKLRFGRVDSIYKEGENYICTLSSSTDKLVLNPQTRVINGLLSNVSYNISEIGKNAPIFFYINPEYDSTVEGLIYDVNTLVVLKP